LQRACDSSEAADYADECTEAKSAIADIRSTIQRGRSVFLPYKTQVQTELHRQTAMIQEISE
jgi:hypothetical protein